MKLNISMITLLIAIVGGTLSAQAYNTPIKAECVAIQKDLNAHPACSGKFNEWLTKQGCKMLSGGGGGEQAKATKKVAYSAQFTSKNCRQVEMGRPCAASEKEAFFMTIVNNVGQNNQICIGK